MAEERGQVDLRDNEETEELAYSAARRPTFTKGKQVSKRFKCGQGKRINAFSQMQDRKVNQKPKHAAMFQEWDDLIKSQKEKKAAEESKKNASQMKPGKKFMPGAGGFKQFVPSASSQSAASPQEPM